MFAIKYHHLRALIYRPYLCYPVFGNLDDNTEATSAQINWPLVSTYERICILEARETARLLHSISSEMDLVQNFPWWQMISCLILAGSVLVVSSIFARHSEDAADGMDAASIIDDAETCLKVFEALSVNSTGARMARDMLERLKEYGQSWSMLLMPLVDNFLLTLVPKRIRNCHCADPRHRSAELQGKWFSRDTTRV